jgi:hypothetical protein
MVIPISFGDVFSFAKVREMNTQRSYVKAYVAIPVWAGMFGLLVFDLKNQSVQRFESTRFRQV